MKRLLLFAVMCIIGIGQANAAVRDASTIARTTTGGTSSAATSRGASVTTRSNKSATTTTRPNTTNTARTSTTTVRSASRATTARNASSATARSATKNANPRNGAITPTLSRTAASNSASRARAAITATNSKTFGTGYTTCRDAYFTCMDQFCATQNDSYRRCVCSSRLDTIKSRENLLSQTADQLQDFVDLNIDVIPKTASEVKAMISASEGEIFANSSSDKSASAKSLAGISEVLNKTKRNALSTQGTLDIAGDIDAIWATTDLTSGATIANLTGESLYNAVHAQCVTMVETACETESTLKMVVSAYGMYIENDCMLLQNALDKKTNNAKAKVRETEQLMHSARLENYDAHNSTEINDCVAKVRNDLTASNACGEGYVHCLDVSGRYLNRDTGAPIYSPDFYQLNKAVSLSGDVLKNQTNRLLVAELNNKKEFAKRSLDTCRDLSGEVWDEFMRQAIAEIYQGQQERIRQVKTECLDVVTNCYDEQNQSLKDFSNIKEQLLLGRRLELSEEMCKEKLNACANLYSDGKGGMTELLVAMHDIVTQQIAQACLITLQDYTKDICAVSSKDTLHTYPYGCRVYRPGSQKYASRLACNSILVAETKPSDNNTGDNNNNDNNKDDNNNDTESNIIYYDGNTSHDQNTEKPVCFDVKVYTSCKVGYYLNNGQCITCPAEYTCDGGNTKPFKRIETEKEPEPEPEPAPEPEDVYYDESQCGDYAGSLYQKLVRYAREVCVRPSLKSYDATPATVLQDINQAMDEIRAAMAKTLSDECIRLGGTWVDNAYDSKISTDLLFNEFYKLNSASTDWGYCADPSGSMKVKCQENDGTWVSATSTCNCKDQTKEWDAIQLTCVTLSTENTEESEETDNSEGTEN